MIFVGADDAADVAIPVPLRLSAAGPEPSRFEKDLGSGGAPASLISGRLPVFPDGVSDIGADVLLLRAAEDFDHLTIRPDDLFRRCLRAGIGGFPGIESAAPA